MIANIHCYASHEAGEVFVEPREAVEGCFNDGAAIVPYFYFVPLDDGRMLVAHHKPEVGPGGQSRVARFETAVTEADFEAGLPIPEAISFDVFVTGSDWTDTRGDGTFGTQVSIDARFSDAIYHVEADVLLRSCRLRWPYPWTALECQVFEPELNCP